MQSQSNMLLFQKNKTPLKQLIFFSPIPLYPLGMPHQNNPVQKKLAVLVKESISIKLDLYSHQSKMFLLKREGISASTSNLNTSASRIGKWLRFQMPHDKSYLEALTFFLGEILLPTPRAPSSLCI